MIAKPAAAFAAYRANNVDIYHFYAPTDLHTIEADATLNAQKLLAPGGLSFFLIFNMRRSTSSPTRRIKNWTPRSAAYSISKRRRS